MCKTIKEQEIPEIGTELKVDTKVEKDTSGTSHGLIVKVANDAHLVFINLFAVHIVHVYINI